MSADPPIEPTDPMFPTFPMYLPSRHCDDCDVEWRGVWACWLCGKDCRPEPERKPKRRARKGIK